MTAARSAYASECTDSDPAQGHPPRLRLFLTEPLRGSLQLSALPFAWPWLARAPRGSGQGVLVLPGLMATDSSTLALRQFLRTLGHTAWGWRLGRNLGPSADVLDGMPRALRLLAERTGGPVSIVGWSLGGIYAREVARDEPDLVRQVITLGSPFALTDPRQSRANRTFEARTHLHAVGRVRTREQVRRPIPVPSTAIYSRRDGIVHWRSCVEPKTATHENIEVRCAHLGFGADPATMWAVADRLAQPDGQWRPFRAPALLRPHFPAPADRA